MADGDAATSRALGRMEAAVALSSEHWPLNLVAALRLAAAPDPQLLAATLAELQQRHPALRARIAVRGRRRTFLYGDVPPIPLAVDEGVPSGAWIGTVEAALNTPLPAAGPLAFAHLLHGADGDADLILAFHHAIVDAASATALLGELLTTYAALLAGRPPAATRHETPPAADRLFPSGYQGVQLLARRLGFAARTVPREVRYRLAMRRAGAPPVDPGAKTRVHSALLSGETTAALRGVARRRRLTVNSVLQAALLAAVHHHRYPGQMLPLRLFSFADLRPRLAPPMPPEPLACYVALTWQDVTMDGAQDLWSLAHAAQEGSIASMRGGARLVAGTMSLPLMRMTLAARLRMGNAALSYTGPTPLAGSDGPLPVRALHAFISNLAAGPEFSLRAGVFAGRMTLDAMALDTDMGREAMEAIVAEVAATLQGAAS